ncbi:uncharacterized protein SPSK_03789 [Sporothrix schenckii 1099-18]|uniref:Uncharacterized protein n=1 Tax=Sporothrix schenckii 1099-18 TaxID=1397361 RepID=A0A0F2M0F6_SPOSC|nr:uncharacterized protein SPSK_03789 [Sporothrix schenckii 1099-18]KJR82245.1 hypothetical protein SPSK_03789 [Sporothrix schenckii 1099-18]
MRHAPRYQRNPVQSGQLPRKKFTHVADGTRRASRNKEACLVQAVMRASRVVALSYRATWSPPWHSRYQGEDDRIAQCHPGCGGISKAH